MIMRRPPLSSSEPPGPSIPLFDSSPCNKQIQLNNFLTALPIVLYALVLTVFVENMSNSSSSYMYLSLFSQKVPLVDLCVVPSASFDQTRPHTVTSWSLYGIMNWCPIESTQPWTPSCSFIIAHPPHQRVFQGTIPSFNEPLALWIPRAAIHHYKIRPWDR